MGRQASQPGEPVRQIQAAGRLQGGICHDFTQQCLRILRCTANAMASSPGGLRFKAGARPWLDGLSVVGPVQVADCNPRLQSLVAALPVE